MSNDKKPLARVDRPERFAVTGPNRFYFGNRVHDLRTIDTRTIEALADNPNCVNIQWADPARRPKKQRRPIRVEAAKSSPASAGAPAYAGSKGKGEKGG